jgi:hypothetical protein
VTRFEVSTKWATRLSALATLGFFLSLAVHVQTLLGATPLGGSKWVFVLHGGVFLVFIPLAFDLSRFKTLGWRRLFRLIPVWALALCVIALVYMQVIGRLSIQPPGAEDATAKDIRVLRMFSSAWLLFYLMPALYFRWVPKGLGEQGGKAA